MHFLFKTLAETVHSFFFESTDKTKSGPHIRDAIDLKRIMFLVVIALIPCTFMAIYNSGLQAYVYGSFNEELLKEYFLASNSFSGYFTFAKNHFVPIITKGLYIFIPILMLSYLVGGFWEIIFAAFRNKEVSEGYLVTGILIALILPPSIPYWMIIVGVSFGVIIGKELYGGTGMNVLNPALVCRCLLFFAFPSYMTGQIWVGTNSFQTQKSIEIINANVKDADHYTTNSILAILAPSHKVKRIHVDACALSFTKNPEQKPLLKQYLAKYNPRLSIENLKPQELQNFVTSPDGLGLASEFFQGAFQFALAKYSRSIWTDTNFFFGNMIGSLGETSTFACLIGALLLLVTGVGSWHIMLAFLIGSFCTAGIFYIGSHFGFENGAWNPAQFDLLPHKHLLIGGLAFGLVFMATDPVSSPVMQLAKWIYGILIGSLVIVIRVVNPAFPEGVMLAILFGNVFAPLFDSIALYFYRKKRPVLKDTWPV